MSDDPNNGGDDSPQRRDLKDPVDLTEDSISFIHMAAGVGIEFIETEANHPNILLHLRQIFMDIQKEVTASRSVQALHCYQCAAYNHNDPNGYATCLHTCVNP